MSATTAAVPSSRDFTLVGVAYGTFVLGLFLFWPSVIGLVLAYVKRGDVAGSMLESPYRWLIRTFWWSALWWAVIIAAMLSVIIPNALVIGDAARTGNYLSIPWSLIGAAIAGAMALAIVWFWTVYRLLRGVIRLADGRVVP